jgi:hypothetical protein
LRSHSLSAVSLSVARTRRRRPRLTEAEVRPQETRDQEDLVVREEAEVQEEVLSQESEAPVEMQAAAAATEVRTKLEIW